MFQKKTLTDQDLKELKRLYKDDLENQIEKVKKGYPVQYLIGNVPFFNTTILVNPDVLIPRFETEYLIEKILKKMEKNKKEALNLLDVGTGSGCIAIALAKNTNWRCLGVDKSESALKVARNNNEINQTQVLFKKLDLLSEPIENFDVLVSNPPYISIEENYDPPILYEPKEALFALENGTLFYRVLLEKIKNEPKMIAFEIGEQQGQIISKMAKKRFPKAKITIEKDLCEKDRYIFIENLD
ncbi:MAG: peptide chain release factor N(5)-glutamine methyltransferase [Bacilli bacterium]|nr:peptide chain release factor N(5)-glutamine methyltransferase [Bacilli bacterium]